MEQLEAKVKNLETILEKSQTGVIFYKREESTVDKQENIVI